MAEQKAAVEVKQEGDFKIKSKPKKMKDLGSKSKNEVVKVDLTKPKKEEVKIEDQPYWLQRFLVDTGEMKVNFWLDSDQKLKKIAIPDSEVEIIRE